jgi:hypothetical protein
MASSRSSSAARTIDNILSFQVLEHAKNVIRRRRGNECHFDLCLPGSESVHLMVHVHGNASQLTSFDSDYAGTTESPTQPVGSPLSASFCHVCRNFSDMVVGVLRVCMCQYPLPRFCPHQTAGYTWQQVYTPPSGSSFGPSWTMFEEGEMRIIRPAEAKAEASTNRSR